MSNLNPAEEQDAARCESFQESQKRGVFVDEFGRENPQVSTGSCKPATKGPLAEVLKRPIAANFVHSIISGNVFVKFVQQLERKYGRITMLRLMDAQLVELIKEKFEIELALQVQFLHEEKLEWDKDVIDQIRTPDGQYPPYEEKPKTDNSDLGGIINGMMGGSANENKD